MPAINIGHSRMNCGNLCHMAESSKPYTHHCFATFAHCALTGIDLCQHQRMEPAQGLEIFLKAKAT